MSAKKLAPLVPAALDVLTKLAEAKPKGGNKATRQTSSATSSDLTAVAIDALNILVAATTKDGKNSAKKSSSSRDKLQDARPNASRSAAAASNTAAKGRDKTWSSKSNTEKAIEVGQVVAQGVAMFLEQKQKAGQGASRRAK